MNTSNKNQLRFCFLSFVAILIISFIVLYPSFNLAFEDEEWQGIVNSKTTYSTSSPLSSYSSPMWFLGTLYTWLGPNFFPYFILSFIIRNLVAFSILIFLYILTKNRLASFLGSLLVAVGFTGIQTTYEAINMISYISMIGVVIFLFAFFKTYDRLSFRYLTTMAVSLLFATIVVSPRVYPLYAWAFMVDSLRLLMRLKKDIFKSFLVRQLVIVTVFLFLYQIGIFSWYSRAASPENKINDFSRFVSDSISSVASLNSNIANFIKSLGNIIFPDILHKSGTISLLLGVFYMIIVIGLFIDVIKRRTKDSYLLLAFLVWPLLFYTSYFVIYINSSPASPIIGSHMRYLFPPFIGLCIAVGIFLSLLLKINNRLSRIILACVMVFVVIHALTTYTFLSKLSKMRDGSYMVKIWAQIKQLVPESSLNPKKTNIFYFETDGSARAIYTVNDGFIGHAIAIYKIDSKPAKFDSTEISSFGRLLAPPLLTFEELVSYIRKSLADNQEPDIWNRIFAFSVEGDTILDIREEVKKRVEAALKE